VFIISEGKHALFRREGKDLHTSITITLKEALLGFVKEIKHLDHRKIEVSRDTVTQPGYIIKLKNEGMPIHQRSGEFGDLFITVNVKFPEVLTEQQRLLADQLFLRRSNW
jgi:DnaJ-class molecular chaperone